MWIWIGSMLVWAAVFDYFYESPAEAEQRAYCEARPQDCQGI